MSNLIERLRDEPSWYHIRRHGLPLPDCEVWHRVCCEAADALEEKDRRIAELEKDSKFLDALYAAGVDNWEGYGQAQDMMEESDDGE